MPLPDKYIPARPNDAVPGSVFCQQNMNNSIIAREQNILNEFLNGNIPDFLRKLASIKITSKDDYIVYSVLPDYLSIGSDTDYVRMPMNPLTAQKIADKYDCTLPTKKMVDDIWQQSVNKVAPLPWGPPYDASMMSTNRYLVHNSRIQKQLENKDYSASTSGQKKDVIITNKIAPNNPQKRVAIYGWIQLDGKPIQVYPTAHEDTYADYSHGIRLIANDVVVNGMPMRIQDVFKDPKLSYLLNDDGPLNFLRY